MAAVTQKIPNLLGGVSQQPDPVKLPGQVRDAENVYLDVTFGARKRPPTKLVSVLSATLSEDARWFPIIRDGNERYAVAMYTDTNDGDKLKFRVWDMNNGIERTVVVSDVSKDYFDQCIPEEVAELTVSDYTLLCNTNRVVTMNENISEVNENEEALVVVKQVAYNSNYAIDLDGSAGTVQNEVQRATKISVSPGSWVNGGGDCQYQAAEEFSISKPEEGKTGLNFRLVNQCTAKLNSGKEGEYWYDSVNTTQVVLSNGGEGWEVGDTVSVSMAGKGYSIRVDEVGTSLAYNSDGTAAFSTPQNNEAGVLDIGQVTAGLVEAVNLIENYEAVATGNVIKITKTNGEAFGIAVRGGVVDTALQAMKGIAKDVASLPDQCFDGYVLKVNNTEDSDSDDYYVKFTTQSPGAQGAGSWEETVKPGIKLNINASTMPQALIRQADGSFTLEPLTDDTAFGGWASREVGDETSNPEPSFVGRAISTLFFHQNRLGFLSEDAVIMSQPGDYFNFFTVSALTISDADPIDVTASSTAPAILKAAIGDPSGLLLFGERSQFMLSTEEVVFSANTVKLKEISQFFYKSTVDPISTGTSAMFISEQNTYSKVMEIVTQSTENRPLVADITRIVPEYVPPSLILGATSPNNSMVVYGDGTEDLYVFKFFNQGNERQQAGWSRWKMSEQIKMVAFEDDLVWFVGRNADRVVLMRMELTDDPDTAPLAVGFSRFVPRLDNYIYKADVTVTPDVNEISSRVDIPDGLAPVSNILTVISLDGTSTGSYERYEVQTDDNGRFIMADFRLTLRDFIIGIDYTSRLELPAIFVTQDGKADRMFPPMVEFVYFDLYYSGQYDITLEKIGYADVHQSITPAFANQYPANTVVVDEISTISVPVFSRGDQALVTITSSTPMPSSLTGYSWQGHYNNRGVANLPA